MKTHLLLLLLLPLLITDAHAEKKKKRSRYSVLNERIEELEIANSLDIFNFSGVNKNMLDLVESDGEQNVWMRSYIAFDAFVDTDEDLKYYIRMSATKYWNEYKNRNHETLGDIGFNRAHIGAYVLFEKAYFDWYIKDNFVFSLGRLPSVDGSPLHWQTNESRLGTFPRLSRNGNMDGLGFTYIKDIWGGRLATRFIYSPLQHLADPVADTDQTNARPIPNGDLNQTPVAVLHLDYNSTPNWADSFNLITQYTYTESLEVIPSVNSMGLTYVTLHADAENVFNKNLNIGFSYSVNQIDSKTNNTTQGGIYSSLAEEKVIGSGFLLAFNYQLRKIDARIGLNYFSANENFLFYDSGSLEIERPYETRGDSVHLYYTHSLKETLTLRVGYRMNTTKFVGSGSLGSIFGAPQELSEYETTNVTYLSTDFTF